MNLLHTPDAAPGTTAWELFDTVSGLINKGDVDAASELLGEVEERHGKDVYEDVCSKISRHYGIPDKDVKRP